MAVSHGEAFSNINPMDSFRLVAETQQLVSEVTQRSKNILIQSYKRSEDLAASIERMGTPVYCLKQGIFGQLLLCVLGFEPGFIPPVIGRRFRILEKALTFLEKKQACHFRHGVFVVTKPLFTVGFLAHQLHHWIAFQSGLPGYDEREQSLYRKFWEQNQGVVGPEVEQMSADEIVCLKNAINRDMEALSFLQKMLHELMVPSKQGAKLINGSATI